MDTNDIKLIIESLHQAQETSERLILSQQISDRQIRLLTKRLKRFLELNANYIDFSIASIIEQPLKKNIQSTAISLKDVEINSQFFEIVNISIVSNKAKAITEIFLKVEDDSSPFGSKLLGEDSVGFQLSLPDGKVESDLIERLSSLGTTDWNTAKSMFVLLEKLFIEHTAVLGSLRKETGKLLEHINTQAAKFSAWPATLRFDRVITGKIKHSENYHSLQLIVSNLSIGQKIYPNFEFKLSTVTDESNSFGSHPRLEFPETCQSIIENWYAESSDDNGGKLELRLAAPNALDTTVWGLLSDADKLLITGLIGKLPTIIEKLAKAEPSASMRWVDWYSLATDTRAIFVKNMIAQRNSIISNKQPQPA